MEGSQRTTQKEANNHMEKQSVPALVFYLQLLLFSWFLSLSPSPLWRWDLAVGVLLEENNNILHRKGRRDEG